MDSVQLRTMLQQNRNNLKIYVNLKIATKLYDNIIPPRPALHSTIPQTIPITWLPASPLEK